MSERPSPAEHTRFFVVLTVAVIVLVFVAFSPTYYLAELVDYQMLHTRGMARRGLSITEHVHGLLGTLWLAAFLGQALLAQRGRTALHRRVGWLGFLLSAMLATSIAFAMVETTAARNAAGVRAPDFVAYTNRLFWGNVAMLVPFTGFVVAAMAFRHRPNAHKRLIVLSMLCLLSPAIGRIAQFDFLGVPAPMIMLPLYLPMLAALPVHDFRVERSVHPLSALGPLAIFVAAVLGAFVVPDWPAARTLVSLL